MMFPCANVSSKRVNMEHGLYVAGGGGTHGSWSRHECLTGPCGGEWVIVAVQWDIRPAVSPLLRGTTTSFHDWGSVGLSSLFHSSKLWLTNTACQKAPQSYSSRFSFKEFHPSGPERVSWHLHDFSKEPSWARGRNSTGPSTSPGVSACTRNFPNRANTPTNPQQHHHRDRDRLPWMLILSADPLKLHLLASALLLWCLSVTEPCVCFCCRRKIPV